MANYQDNQAVLQYQLEMQGLTVAEKLLQDAPRPLLVNNQANGESSALSTLLLAQILPEMMKQSPHSNGYTQMPDWMKDVDSK